MCPHMISCRLFRLWNLEGAKKLLLSLQNVAEDLENHLLLGFCFGIEQHTCEQWFNIQHYSETHLYQCVES